jgi:predicted Zn-dependent protease
MQGYPKPAGPRLAALLLWTLFIAGCAAAPQASRPAPAPPTTTGTESRPAPARERPAQPRPAPGPAASLQLEAEAALAAGDPDRAATLLERGLRLEPRNASLWLSLARARDAEGDEAQAEQLALRAVREAGSQPELQRRAWTFIVQLRERRGDSAGADTARRRAADAGGD